MAQAAYCGEPILLGSSDDEGSESESAAGDEDRVRDSLADDRPPSDYESSVTLSSGDDDSDEQEEEEEEEEEDNEDEEKENGQDIVNEDTTRGNDVADSTTAAADNSINLKSSQSKDSVQETVGTKKAGKGKKSPKKKSATKEKKPRKKNFERRNIRKIIKEHALDENTVNAQREEEERKKRLAAGRTQIFSDFNMAATTTVEDAPNLKSLLTAMGSVRPGAVEHCNCEAAAPDPSILSSITRKHDVVELLSSDDDDECVILDSVVDDEADEGGDEDPENSGIHVDDSKNQPDSLGRVLVNVCHPSSDPDVFLSPQVARAVKPHQIGGIRFLYDNLVESLPRFNNSQGFGCILAHSMGLGKTLQVVGFTDVFMRCTDGDKVLIIVPINTLQNWINEFDMWLPSPENVQGISPDEVGPRSFTLHVINDTHKTVSSRAQVIEKWSTGGGVLLMGYEMFRLLATRNTKTRKRKANAGPELIDIDLEEKKTGLQLDMQQALLDPGPELVICDEGHRIKNSHAGISKSLKQINTKRRVVLTGYPLQNNLVEYWCMVDFVRPNFLGSKVEFSNMFERPISNGQCADSTPGDVKLMRYRAHVLHNLLEGFVQRRNHKVLMNNLPPKEEWVLMIKMSAFQRQIYNMFMENIKLDTDSCIGGTNPLKAFAVACKIWNHPDVMQTFLNKQADNDLELDIALSANGSPSLSNGSISKRMKKSASEGALSMRGGAGRRDSPLLTMFGMSERSSEISYDWVKPVFETYRARVVENSGKFVLLFQIIEETLRLNERLLVFSQSLMTLNLLEEFLTNMPAPLSGLCERWTKNRTYYRLDGSTNGSERERLINQFNSEDNKEASLFLLSTKAGCLGINLIGANRVVMLDASWNPCHDCQAVCRVYRYGQRRPCFIYRFVTDNTMEKKIYDRQVSKQGMADRVVDEIQVQSQFSKKENEQLLEYQDRDLETMDPTGIEQKCFDPVLRKVIEENHHWITQSPFTHESLLIEASDQKMTRTDKRLAKEMYEQEKKLSVSFSRQSYANYYQNKPLPPPPVFRGPSLPPMSQHTLMPRPNMTTPQVRSDAPHSFDFRQNVTHQIRPGVTVQTIQAHKDIVAPGPECRVIKQGELLTVIRTPKGSYIKLMDGKIFAIRNRTEAEKFGLADGNSVGNSSGSTVGSSTAGPCPTSNGSDQMLSSLLQGSRGRHMAPPPNLVERRRHLQLGTPYEAAPATSASLSSDHTTVPASLLPNSYSPFPDNPMPDSDNFFPLTHNDFYQPMGTGDNNSMVAGSGINRFLTPLTSQYPAAFDNGNMTPTGYQSHYNAYHGPPPTTGWEPPRFSTSHPDPLGINGILPTSQSTSSTLIRPPTGNEDDEAHILPNLSNLLRLQTPLILPSIDAVNRASSGPAPTPTDGYDSDASLPSLDGVSPGTDFVNGKPSVATDASKTLFRFLGDREEATDNG